MGGEGGAPSLTVVSWNAHWGVERGRDSRARPFDPLAELGEWVDDADVLVLAESWRPHGRPGFADRLRERGFEVAEVRFVTLDLDDRPSVAHPGQGWWCLLVATTLPVLARRALPLARVFHDPAGRRHAISLSLDVAGAPVDFVGVHVSSKLWYAGPVVHLRSLRALLPASPRPAVVAGDCNLWGPAVERLLPGWRRTVRGRTYPARRPHSQIDHVLVRGPVGVEAAEVGPRWSSDHRAVRVRLRIGGGPRPR